MSKLDFIDDLGATLFCSGQDWKPGDGSASNVDVHCDKAKQRVKELMLELIGKDIVPTENRHQVKHKHCAVHQNTYLQELRQKVEAL